MRTRSRTIEINRPSYQESTRRCAGTTYVSGGATFLGLPIKVSSTYLSTNRETPNELRSFKETIVDDVGGDRSAFHAVDHVKYGPCHLGVEPGTPILPVETASPGGGAFTTYPTYRDNQLRTNGRSWRANIVSPSYIPQFTSWLAASGQAALVPNGTMDSSLISYLGNLPSDRLGEIPAHVVRAIEGWNASTTAIESRDMPALFNMWGRREALREGLEGLRAWRATGRRLPQARTVIRALEGYRSGQLAYSFGLMPTVSDIRTIAKEVGNGLKARRKIIRVSLRGQTERPHFVPWNGNSAYYGLWQMREVARYSRVDGAQVALKRPGLQSDSFQNAVERLIGVNGARLIWDVMPFSWAVDMVLSLDDMLDLLWCNSQTEYDITYWSSTSIQYERVVETFSRTQEEIPDGSDLMSIPPVQWSYSHYNRAIKAAPRLIDTLRFRARPMGVFLTALVAIGFLPENFRRARTF